MPLDIVEVHKEGREDRWLLRNAKREFHQATLFRGLWGSLTAVEIISGLDVEYDLVDGQIRDVRRYSVLPESTRRVVAHNGCEHVGLALDKLVLRYADQNLARRSLHDVVAVNERIRTSYEADAQHWYRELRSRNVRLSVLDAAAYRRFQCRTRGPLTLHLARASALENAGICLHPVYGFVYLPGTGLKGMAHAYACECWLPGEADDAKRQAAWDTICQVFGWAPSPALRQLAQRLNVTEPQDSRAGEIVFHEAWPTAWPPLVTDIVNNHHPEYYQAKAGDNRHPPGDWEDPVPVYFLAVPAGVEFEFALSKRRRDMDDRLLELAKEWLLGALCHLGAGAKTAAGYGSFELSSQGSVPALPEAARATFEATLELVTPAFLAGAEQNARDCDLRPATLRGLLRWWWRTMHAGHVDVATLRRMEAALWGDTAQGGAVRVEVVRLPQTAPFERPGKLLHATKLGQLEDDTEFLHQNEIPRSPPYTTQGLFYAGYGTDEMVTVGGKKVRKRRWCLGEGAKWKSVITARSWTYRELDQRGRVLREEIITAQMLCEQAYAALWLLCRFGGVGAKGRKGFGSLVDLDALPSWSLATVTETAAKFRDDWRQKRLPYHAGSTATHSIEHATIYERLTPWTNPWFALDQLGAIMQSFAQASSTTGHGKHCAAKASLGLPRKIHGPLAYPVKHQQGKWQKPINLTGPHGARHAAPVTYHLAKNSEGKLIVRAVFFQTDFCYAKPKGPKEGVVESQKILAQLYAYLDQTVAERVAQYSAQGKRPTFPAPALKASDQDMQSIKAAPPKVGDRVDAELLEEKTNKGGWRARHHSSGLVGPVQNSADVPEDKKPHDVVPLIVRIANAREIAFRYPTLADDAASQKSKGSGAAGKRQPRNPGRRR